MIQSEPDYEAALGLIKHLSTEELKALVNEDEKLGELLQDLPQMKNLSQEKQMLSESIRSLADYNLSYQPRLEEGKQELLQRYEEITTFNEELQSMKDKLDTSSSKQSADTIQALLQAAANEKEQETEELTERFMAKEEPVDEFLVEFVSQKTISHTRKVKAEKAAELIRKGTVASTNSQQQYSNIPYQPSTPQWGPGIPYPVQPPNMPMPNY